MKGREGGVPNVETFADRVGRGRCCSWRTRRQRGKVPTDHEKRPVGSAVPVKKPAPTYAKDVAAILQSKCQNCHRRHQVGPFRPRDI